MTALIHAVAARVGSTHLGGAVAVAVALLLTAGVLATSSSESSAQAPVASPTTTTTVAETTSSTTSPPMVAARQPVLGHPGPQPPATDEAREPFTVDHANVQVPTSSLIATVTGPEVGVAAEPGGAATMVLGGTTSFGSTRVFLLTGAETDEWVEVWLPVRPNGSRGWVARDSVSISTTTYAIGVEQGTRAFTVFDAGVPVYTVPVAIGSPAAPTPSGHFFVTDVIATPSPGGSYGPYAFGVSGYSDVHTEFQGGDGQVGFHGTNEPWSIGQRVSAGCLRMENQHVTHLVGMLPLGVPIIIV